MKKRTGIKFSLVVSGDGDFEKKLLEATQSSPTKSTDIVKALGTVLCLAFNWGVLENVTFDSFKAGKLEENTTKPGDQAD